MKKTVVAALVSMAFGANAANMDNLRISGFGSVGIGKSDNAIGYAGYTDEKLDWEQETLAGLQFDFQVNERAKFVTQIVANSRYDYEPKIEMAYASYDFDSFTVRAGKLRLPLFFYSDYTDLGYAYPMIRPSQELYENIVLKGYTGADLLIPIELEDSSILLQPVVGIGTIDEDDSIVGEVKLDKLFGISANWNVDDFTFRGSYFVAESNPSCDFQSSQDPYCQLGALLDGQDGQFISLGAQYDNGDLLVNVEAADVQLEGQFYDYQSVSGLVGYRVNEFTPYVSVGWVETTDNEDRENMTSTAIKESMNYERLSYSVGSRWDFAKNMSLKADVTYVDYRDTSGGFQSNVETTVDPRVATGNYLEDSSIVYSARLDFVF
ncbi:outer membrane protein [Vibrio crassostreae]|uniref:outer membrane protein n=1 Tax=Vibrio crassostreae TaxID=246167 RepID=UPI002FE1DFD6